MIVSTVVKLVDVCRKSAIAVVTVALIVSIALGAYVSNTIKINTDIDQLMASDLGWRQQERELATAFPQNTDRLVVVVDGDNADIAENAAKILAEEMGKRPDFFKNVSRPDNIPFFRQHGLLYLDQDKLNDMLDMLVQAQPMLGTIANDPSLRGLFNTLDLVILGLKQGQFDYEKIDQPLGKLAEVIENVTAGKNIPMPWRSMMSGDKPSLRDIRKIILTQPVMDFSSLSPGKAASEEVRKIAQERGLTPENGARVRMTGSVALNDEEFASVAEGTTFATVLSVVLVMVILFLALRSARLILPILLTLTSGLIATTAFAMATVGSLNLISVAFAVMFVGIAVDFGIQFGVRYRDQRHSEPDSAQAMLSTAKIIAMPLALAAGSTALGFLTFIPTDYRGVAELGLIAGGGMVIAFLLNITLLPALLALFKPPAEPEAIGFTWAKPIDEFIVKHRKQVLAATAVVAVISGTIALTLNFDFDPLNLKNKETESVSTLFDLMQDPQANIYTIDILASSLADAQKMAEEIGKLPEVDHAMTLASFIPENQEQKLAMIGDANLILAPTLNPAQTVTPPTDDDIIEALKKTASNLKEVANGRPTAERLTKALETVVERQNSELLRYLNDSLISGMANHLALVRELLSVQPVTIDSITEDLRRDWITSDGRAKITVYPKGNARDHSVLESFAAAVKTVAPNASGTAISIQESGKTVSSAFLKAGAFAVLSIALLVLLILRNFREVGALLAPLILAGILTLATMVITGIPLNFANIIALPLLLSLGVSYAIYFVSYWKQGMTAPLQSSMARAVLFSASTTLVAFGTLSISTHPGTSSMGEILTIALLYSLACTFIVLPALLGLQNKAKSH